MQNVCQLSAEVNRDTGKSKKPIRSVREYGSHDPQ
jgi:hypothetical protein